MSYDRYLLLKFALGVLATIGLYSVLYKENKFYRFWEHVFVGLATGWTLVILWVDVLKPNWWDKMLGKPAEGANPEVFGYWTYAFLLPIGLLGYFVFSKRHNWISRIPIGIILGLYSGQQFNAWWLRYSKQINDSLKPIWPTTWNPLFRPSTKGLSPEALADVQSQVYASQALNNLIFLITVLSVLSYFLFSFEVRNRALSSVQVLGRWLLMIGFGAIFGSTVMMRFTLLIDRMSFIWVEFLKERVLNIPG